jgi:hypothetical protein
MGLFDDPDFQLLNKKFDTGNQPAASSAAPRAQTQAQRCESRCGGSGQPTNNGSILLDPDYQLLAAKFGPEPTPAQPRPASTTTG